MTSTKSTDSGGKAKPILLVEGQRRFLDSTDSPFLGRFIGIRPSWGIPSHEYVEWLSKKPWAADNGAFAGFEPLKFLRFLDRLEGWGNCLFVTTPDVVKDMGKTLQQFEVWEATIRKHGFPVALALQDGLTAAEQIPWGKVDALFVGGSNQFKHSSIVQQVVVEAKSRGIWVHVGRVNQNRRIRYVRRIGADSFDGSGFSQNIRHIKRALRLLGDNQQTDLIQP